MFNIFVEKKIKKNNRTLNKTSITKDFYDMFIVRFIYGKKLSGRFLNKFFKSAIMVITTNRGDSNIRIGIFPYTKWYVKGYFKKYVIEETKKT